MQQFTVPQFIDVEDKIIGPITARQFIIMLTGLFFIGISFKIFDFAAFIIVSISIFAISGVFAFFKVNGMPFHYFVLNFVQTKKNPNVRVWNNTYGKEEPVEETGKELTTPKEEPVKRMVFNKSRLNELSLIVDTKGAYQGEDLDAKIKIKNENELKLEI